MADPSSYPFSPFNVHLSPSIASMQNEFDDRHSSWNTSFDDVAEHSDYVTGSNMLLDDLELGDFNPAMAYSHFGGHPMVSETSTSPSLQPGFEYHSREPAPQHAVDNSPVPIAMRPQPPQINTQVFNGHYAQHLSPHPPATYPPSPNSIYRNPISPSTASTNSPQAPFLRTPGTPADRNMLHPAYSPALLTSPSSFPLLMSGVTQGFYGVKQEPGVIPPIHHHPVSHPYDYPSASTSTSSFGYDMHNSTSISAPAPSYAHSHVPTSLLLSSPTAPPLPTQHTAPGRGRMIPQNKYRPHTEADRIRYVKKVDLQDPVHFNTTDPGVVGISLADAMAGKYQRLDGRDDRLFQECGPSISIRINWAGCYAPWSRQIPTRDFKTPPGPVTRAKVAKNVARSVQRFIEEMSRKPLEDDADPGWAVGTAKNGIMLEDLALVRLEHVSKGSWQAQLCFVHQHIAKGGA